MAGRRTPADLAVASEIANPALRAALASRAVPVAQSAHFSVFELDGVTAVLHRLRPAEIDNDLAELVAGELVRPGHVRVPGAFERCFAGVVLSSAPAPSAAWRAFYENTLRGLRRAAEGALPAERGPGPVAAFGGIYERASALVAGSAVLDVGTCFGFFPLLLHRSHPHLDVVAVDLSAPMVELAREAAAPTAPSVRFVRGDARDLPFAGDAFDTVTALHLLEHLPPQSAERALREMCRVARRRVVAAVPLEKEPDPAYGHVQAFDREGLTKLAQGTGWRCTFEDHLGGWVVLEPP